MPALESVPDSTDWLSTPLSSLAPLESALRCQVCKDFFNTPMITSCSHTFCSLCIRRYLSQEGRCPTCRSGDQELKLRRNWAVEEVVASFVASREGLLEFATAAASRTTKPDEEEGQRPKKRRKVVDNSRGVPARRSTRGQSRKVVLTSGSERLEDDFIADSEASSEGFSEYEDQERERVSQPARAQEPEPNDGLVSCPGCNKRMKAETVFAHLDNCESAGGGGGSTSEAAARTLARTNGSTNAKIRPVPVAHNPPSSITKQRDRLPTLAYDMLNDNLLRKKLKELGISNQGPKLLLQKRHTEWINLWNASCDSRNPRTKRELLQELDIWERTQGRQILNAAGPTGVMAKDFDGEGWIRGNKDDFDALVRKAREKRALQSAAAAAAAATNVAPAAVPHADLGRENSQNGNKEVEAETKAAYAGHTGGQPHHPPQSNQTVDLTTSPIKQPLKSPPQQSLTSSQLGDVTA